MTPDNNQPFLYPPQPLLPRGRILLVDEDEKDLKYFTTLLGRMGYSVRAFMNHREAEGCLEHEHFDFVIVSQGSPAFETRALVQLTLARDRHKPVVVLTRCLEMNCYLEAMQLGAVDYLEKPLAPAEIIALLETFIPRRGGMDDSRVDRVKGARPSEKAPETGERYASDGAE
jgi:two-component system phosphoglycerate transport system response regulator PgtA